MYVIYRYRAGIQAGIHNFFFSNQYKISQVEGETSAYGFPRNSIFLFPSRNDVSAKFRFAKIILRFVTEKFRQNIRRNEMKHTCTMYIVHVCVQRVCVPKVRVPCPSSWKRTAAVLTYIQHGPQAKTCRINGHGHGHVAWT
jgi:hypothetical protein